MKKLKKKINVLVLMPLWHASAENRLFKTVKTLREKGYVVNFCVLTEKMNFTKEIYLPGTPFARLNRKELVDVGAIAINSLKDLFFYALKSNVVIMGTGKGLEKVDKVFSMLLLPRIEVNDIGELYPRLYNPDILALNSELVKDTFMLNPKKTAKDIDISVIGDIRFDNVSDAVDKQQREAFFSKYNIKYNEKYLLFCTGALQRIDKWTENLYKQIMYIVNKSDYKMLLRRHPNDLGGHKKDKIGDGVDIEALFCDFKSVDPEDYEKATKMCAAMITVDSGTKFEMSLFYKNVIAVNTHESSLLESVRDKGIFPRDRFRGFSLQSRYQNFLDGSAEGAGYIMPHGGIYSNDGIKLKKYTWVGADCHISQLEEVLKNSKLEMIDKNLAKEHIKEYWFSDDGKAYLRLSELVPKLLLKKGIKKRAFRPYFIRLMICPFILLKLFLKSKSLIQ